MPDSLKKLQYEQWMDDSCKLAGKRVYTNPPRFYMTTTGYTPSLMYTQADTLLNTIAAFQTGPNPSSLSTRIGDAVKMTSVSIEAVFDWFINGNAFANSYYIPLRMVVVIDRIPEVIGSQPQMYIAGTNPPNGTTLTVFNQLGRSASDYTFPEAPTIAVRDPYGQYNFEVLLDEFIYPKFPGYTTTNGTNNVGAISPQLDKRRWHIPLHGRKAVYRYTGTSTDNLAQINAVWLSFRSCGVESPQDLSTCAVSFVTTLHFEDVMDN